MRGFLISSLWQKQKNKEMIRIQKCTAVKKTLMLKTHLWRLDSFLSEASPGGLDIKAAIEVPGANSWSLNQVKTGLGSEPWPHWRGDTHLTAEVKNRRIWDSKDWSDADDGVIDRNLPNIIKNDILKASLF